MHWLGRHRLLILAAISLFWTGLVLLLHFYPDLPFLSAVWSGEKRFEDFLQREGRKTATRDDFVFLGIDQSTLELPPFEPGELANNRALQLMVERPFPWSREVWALLLDRLFASGARLVMFDLIFNPPNDGEVRATRTLDKPRPAATRRRPSRQSERGSILFLRGPGIGANRPRLRYTAGS